MTDLDPNTCTVNGTIVTVIYKFTNPKDNLYVEIIEQHKSSSAIIDQDPLIGRPVFFINRIILLLCFVCTLCRFKILNIHAIHLMLSKLNQQSEEKRLKSLYEAKLVLSFDNILEWNGGNERDREIKVYNYSRASTVDKTLIRSDDELEEIAEELEEGFPWEILAEDPYESKQSYLIFGDIHSIDNFIKSNKNV